MFVVDVYNRLAMPEFSATLLKGLLGISAGTFVGFKLPETNQENRAEPLTGLRSNFPVRRWRDGNDDELARRSV